MAAAESREKKRPRSLQTWMDYPFSLSSPERNNLGIGFAMLLSWRILQPFGLVVVHVAQMILPFFFCVSRGGGRAIFLPPLITLPISDCCTCGVDGNYTTASTAATIDKLRRRTFRANFAGGARKCAITNSESRNMYFFCCGRGQH